MQRYWYIATTTSDAEHNRQREAHQARNQGRYLCGCDYTPFSVMNDGIIDKYPTRQMADSEAWHVQQAFNNVRIVVLDSFEYPL